MLRKSKLSIVAAFVLLTAVLAGCASPQTTPEPTVDTQPTFAFVQTQAVQTAVAEMTLNAPTATATVPPTEVPTATLMPTAIVTPLPSATPTAKFIPWTVTPAASATPVATACTVTEQSPANGTDIQRGSDFDARWVVKNTGTQNWQASNMDFVYVSGQTKMHTGPDVLDLKQDVTTQGTYTIILDMVAPGSDGTYSTSWALVSGSQTFCTLSFSIDVVP